MADILKGAPVAQAIKEEMIQRIAALKEKGVVVRIVIVRVGDREDDLAYERRVIGNCEKVGIEAVVEAFPSDISEEEFCRIFKKINEDPMVHGILLFRPLPKGLPEEKIVEMVDPEKDIDCMNSANLDRVFHGRIDGMLPCTPEAVVEILKFYGVKLEGANVVVVNRSMVLGKPLSMMLLSENATVTVCHSKTRNLKAFMAAADIVVTGVGRPAFFGPEYFSDKNVVIDVGINFSEEGKMVGDVDFAACESVVSAITPVPGGVGGVTSMILLRHGVLAAEKAAAASAGSVTRGGREDE